MNAAIVARTLSLIPDRVPRVQSGSAFDPTAPACCAHPDRITHLASFLSWLGPLHPITKEDLRILGFMAPFGKPAIAVVEDEVDDDLPLAAEPQPVTLPVAQPEAEATLT
jgi:hypothetical protein